MSQWDYKIDQPMPGPFPFPNLRKGPGIEVGGQKDSSPVWGTTNGHSNKKEHSKALYYQ